MKEPDPPSVTINSNINTKDKTLSPNIDLLSTVLTDQTIRVNLTDPSKGFEIPLTVAEVYAESGVIPTSVEEKISQLPLTVQRHILKKISNLIKIKDKRVSSSVRDQGPDITEIAEMVMQRMVFATLRDTEEVLFFEDGIYHSGGEVKIKEIVHNLLKGEESSRLCTEVIGKVQRSTYIDRNEFFSLKQGHKIAVANGLLDLDSYQLSPFDSKFFTMNKLPVAYDPHATCPKIYKFHNEVIKPEDLSLLQEITGYLLWIWGNPAQKATMFIGKGGNGKSTEIRLEIALIGKENISAISLHELEENRFAKAQLYNKMANFYADLSDRDLRSVGTFKAITGGDAIYAEHKNQRGFSFIPNVKLVFSCNNPPRVPRNEEDSVAFFRRWNMLEFPFQFEGKENEDRNLLEELTLDPQELSGYLNWALEGLKQLRTNGFHFPTSQTAKEVQETYITLSDPYKSFSNHCIIVGPELTVVKDELYQSFKKHCMKHGVSPVSRDSFFKNFKDLFDPGIIQDYRPEKKDGVDTRVRMFKGIGLRNEEKWCTPIEDDEIENFKMLTNKVGGGQGGQSGQVGQQNLDNVQGVQGKTENKAGQAGQEDKDSVQGVQSVHLEGGVFSSVTPQKNENDFQEKSDVTDNNITGNVATQEYEKTESHDIGDVGDKPSMFKGNGKNNSEWVYFKVLDDFDYYFSSGEKRRYKKGQIVKFPVINAGKYVLKGLLKLACPEGYWDPVSRECISDMGGNNNE